MTEIPYFIIYMYFCMGTNLPGRLHVLLSVSEGRNVVILGPAIGSVVIFLNKIYLFESV